MSAPRKRGSDMKAVRRRAAEFARTNPKAAEEIWEFIAALTPAENRQLRELSNAERVATFAIMERDGASVDVAVTAALAGDTGASK